MQISHNYWIYVYICLSLASWASLPSLNSFSKEIADPVTHVPHSTSCFHYVYKDLKIQTRTCISPLLFALQGVSQHDLHQAETRGTQRSGSKPGRHVLLRASDVGKLEAGCGEERRPWDCLEEHVPPHVSNWKGYGSKATDRNWTLRPMAAEIGGLDFPDGCCGEWGQASWVVVFCGFKVLRHTETPLWSSSTEQLLCG